GVKGWIKNLQDGNVEIIAEGRKNALDKLIEFCNRGPVGAEVENVDVSWDKPKKEFDIFDVRV
ncbi:MAG: acylphosphatase, partial [Candidatus Aenigmarchaeota archaeon]|nr:acylphosphatase [Candidatus Aenigmarchaeota archaeon]